MRLVAVPLARTRPSVNPISTFVAQRAANAAKVTQESKDPKAVPLSTRLLKKASAFWMDLGRTDQKSTFDWKRRTYVAGERLMDRIEYQEWALKAIDPALGPRLLHENTPESEKSQAKVCSSATCVHAGHALTSHILTLDGIGAIVSVCATDSASLPCLIPIAPAPPYISQESHGPSHASSLPALLGLRCGNAIHHSLCPCS